MVGVPARPGRPTFRPRPDFHPLARYKQSLWLVKHFNFRILLMQIGIGLPNQIREVDAAILPGWAAQAEKADFASLATIGRITYPGVMDTIALAVAAASTTTIGLISAIAVGPAYPAVLLAKEAAEHRRRLRRPPHPRHRPGCLAG
jgi:hypothetical protein